MALISCHECGKQVSTEAAACPACGAPPKGYSLPKAQPAYPAGRAAEGSPWMTALKWLSGLLVGFVALVLFFGSRPINPRVAADQRAECERAIKSGIGHSMRNYSDKIAYEKAVEDACGGPGLPALRGTAEKEGCPAEAPNCSWGR